MHISFVKKGHERAVCTVTIHCTHIIMDLLYQSRPFGDILHQGSLYPIWCAWHMHIFAQYRRLKRECDRSSKYLHVSACMGIYRKYQYLMFVVVALMQDEAHSQCLWVLAMGQAKRGYPCQVSHLPSGSTPANKASSLMAISIHFYSEQGACEYPLQCAGWNECA